MHWLEAGPWLGGDCTRRGFCRKRLQLGQPAESPHAVVGSMMYTQKSQIIAAVCAAVEQKNPELATAIIRDDYPFVSPGTVSRTYTELEATRLFIRDGFLDRYSGNRLVFTPVLRLLSRQFPVEFPFHSNWKMTACHLAYYELTPTVDHVEPIARGGRDDESNWVTTSMLRNSAKANWTLAELGWSLCPAGQFGEWDGLLRWFIRYGDENPGLLSESYFRRWHTAAVRAAES